MSTQGRNIEQSGPHSVPPQAAVPVGPGRDGADERGRRDLSALAGDTAPQQVVEDLYRARAEGRLDVVRRLLHEDVVWREHEGQAGYSGTHAGRDAVMAQVMTASLQVTDGTFRLQVEDIVSYGSHLAVVFVFWSARRASNELAGREVGVYRVAGGQVLEATFLLDDPDGVDEFFTAQSRGLTRSSEA